MEGRTALMLIALALAAYGAYRCDAPRSPGASSALSYAAWDLVDDQLAHPGVRVVKETEEHPRLWSELLRGAGSGGDLTTDAWIAAIALAHGASVLTLDSDFARFPGVRWESPLGS
jgi:predicted nucleic acid-binding protein